MEIVDQHVKGIMEGCKERARDAGLRFADETLEYIVTNRDMIELSPKVMIPTLYDYWVHDVRVLSGQGMYDAYPSNPYETVINTQPAISFYNDNNPDWLNVMIFYHVLAHIDFFQNNVYFSHTWGSDFNGQALSDKRLIAKLRSEKGRWVDYVIEFARGIDNLAGYHRVMSDAIRPGSKRKMDKIDYYFDIFLQREKKVPQNEYIKEIQRYNELVVSSNDPVRSFFMDVIARHPEFDAFYDKFTEEPDLSRSDAIQYMLEHSSFLNKKENLWMKSVVEVVRNTSLFFQPQIRTKIMNEGWASYWHETLFMQDNRIRGHEIDYAKVNAMVTAMPKIGLNPYALGMRLFYHIEDMENRGAYSLEYSRQTDEVRRTAFDAGNQTGKTLIFKLREDGCDFTFINSYIDQEFMNKHRLFVSGKRLNKDKMTWEYYVKSKKALDYKAMLINTLYHPPDIQVDHEKTTQGPLYLVHRFEGKPLKSDYIENTMAGIEFLWGGSVRLETWEPGKPVSSIQRSGKFWDPADPNAQENDPRETITWKRVLYIMEDRKLHKREI